jgi:hypothetical protein
MNPIKLTLSDEVIEAINEEFAYQASLQDKGRADTVDHGVEGQLVVLEHYTRKALSQWTESAGDEAVLDTLRKVAAIAIRSLELYGCPRRLDT